MKKTIFIITLILISFQIFSQETKQELSFDDIFETKGDFQYRYMTYDLTGQLVDWKTNKGIHESYDIDNNQNIRRHIREKLSPNLAIKSLTPTSTYEAGKMGSIAAEIENTGSFAAYGVNVDLGITDFPTKVIDTAWVANMIIDTLDLSSIENIAMDFLVPVELLGTYTIVLKIYDDMDIDLSDNLEQITFTVYNCDLFTIDPVITPDYCGTNNGMLTVNPIGGTSAYTYTFETFPAGGTQNNNILSGLSNGTIVNITVTDANNCEAEETNIYIGGFQPLAATAQQLTNDNCGTSSGAININVSGGEAPYTYLWNTGSTYQDISGLQGGTYTVDITDNNNCTLQQPFTITGNSPYAITNSVITDDLCGQSVGAIDITVTGGSGNNSYNWNSGFSTQEDLTNVLFGEYTVLITDLDNPQCSFEQTYTVQGNPELEITNDAVTDDICGTGEGAINITVAGGTGTYNYNWNSGTFSMQDLINIQSGNFTVNISDATNTQCTLTQSYFVDGNPPLTLNVIVDEDNAVAYVDDISGGTEDYGILWSTNETTSMINIAPSTEYTVTVTDANNCEISFTFQTTGFVNINYVIQEEIIVEVYPNPTDAEINLKANYQINNIDVYNELGQKVYSENINADFKNLDLSSLAAGVYILHLNFENNIITKKITIL